MLVLKSQRHEKAASVELIRLGDGQGLTVIIFPLLLKCISYFSSTCLTSTHLHTSSGTHTYSPFLCITLLLLCPELTVQAQPNHWSYTQPAGSLEVPPSHTPTSSLLSFLAFSLPLFSSLSYAHRHTPSLPYTHTRSSLPPSLPPSRTYCLDRGRSFYQQGYFTLRLWLIRGGVEVEDEAVEEEEAGGMRLER